MIVRRLCSCAVALLLAGCAAKAPVPSDSSVPGAPKGPAYGRGTKINQPMLTCAEATRVARDAVARLGYTITNVQTAKPDAPGVVTGERDSGWSPAVPESGTKYNIKVDIRCSDAGSELEAATDEGVASQLRFPSRFAGVVKQEAEVKPRQMIRHDDAPPQGLTIKVEPQRGAAAQREFAADLPAAGVTPVKFEILNRSSRRYRFRRSDVVLVAVQGKRETPLSPADALQRLKALPGIPALQPVLESKQIADAEIAPGASLKGYLYFPAAAYQRARIELFDVDGEESEGFSVDF